MMLIQRSGSRRYVGSTGTGGREGRGVRESTDGTGVGSAVHGVSGARSLLSANATQLYFSSANRQLLRIPL